MRVWTATIMAALLAAAGPGRGDAEAEALLRKVHAATRALKALSADLRIVRTGAGKRYQTRGKARLQRPNLARISYSGNLGQTVACDGRTLWIFNRSTNQYSERRVEATGESIAHSLGPLIPLAMFFKPDLVTSPAPPGMQSRLAGEQRFDGVSCRILELTIPGMRIRLFVAPNHLVYRSITERTRVGEKVTMETVLSTVRLNRPVAEASFAYAPPRSARLLPKIEVELNRTK